MFLYTGMAMIDVMLARMPMFVRVGKHILSSTERKVSLSSRHPLTKHKNIHYVQYRASHNKCITRCVLQDAGPKRRCSTNLASPEHTDKDDDSIVKVTLPEIEYDWEYLTDPAHTEEIKQNVVNRKGVGDIDKLNDIWRRIKSGSEADCEIEKLSEELNDIAFQIPNRTHSEVPIGDEDMNKQVDVFGEKKEFNFKPLPAHILGEKLDILRLRYLGHTTGHRSYYLKGNLAMLEQALIRFTINRILKKNFTLMSVPDLIHPEIIERCGFKTSGLKTQVYQLDPHKHGKISLAGTGEMPIAGHFLNKHFSIDALPQRICTTSRCYRAEASDAEGSGIYRVHQFTKVEMFVVVENTSGEESGLMLEELKNIQVELFKELDLHCRVLDMSSHELGAPAYRKYDIEAWMPASQLWGEISSASNCIDYQSRRLNIKSLGDNGKQPAFVHSLNATACAIPRMISAILENNQTENGEVNVPIALQPYMGGLQSISQPNQSRTMKWIRFTKPTHVK